jgi:hypothetical protein
MHYGWDTRSRRVIRGARCAITPQDRREVCVKKIQWLGEMLLVLSDLLERTAGGWADNQSADDHKATRALIRTLRRIAKKLIDSE